MFTGMIDFIITFSGMPGLNVNVSFISCNVLTLAGIQYTCLLIPIRQAIFHHQSCFSMLHFILFAV